MSDPYILASHSDGIGRITLNEPERLNPITPERIEQLLAACREMSDNQAVHVVVLSGAGRGFCSGADLASDIPHDFTSRPGSDSLIDFGPGMWSLTAMRQPVIARVNGPAVGFGAELALSADIRIAGTSAMFCFPFSRLGTVSDTGAATWLLPRLIGWSQAAEILYSGRVVESAEAAALGLVNRVVPDDELTAAVDELAISLTERSPRSLEKMKRMIFAGLDERKTEHVMRQYFEYNDRDRDADPKAYFDKVRGSGGPRS